MMGKKRREKQGRLLPELPLLADVYGQLRN
jgi:hypothetical protein